MRIKHLLVILFSIKIILSQEIIEQFLIHENDTIDVFAYQLPENYSEFSSYPLLVAFHQWGGNHLSTFTSTQFDEEAYARNWIFMSPFGGSINNYNHQNAQNMVRSEIKWLQENYSINSKKIYFVGGSMGGAAGAIFSNNHLNPDDPMVAATASASGILDCELRAIEMDGNNSMIQWFGGDYTEVPFEYHRNSAVYFADSSQSMHYNLKYLPIYLDFGVTENHRIHAESLYSLLTGYNQNIWIDTMPTGTHGFSVIDEEHACNWLNQFELEDDPDTISVNLDEPSRAYWIEAINKHSQNNFIRINANRFYDSFSNGITLWEGYGFSINHQTNTDSLILHILEEQYLNRNNIIFQINTSLNIIGFRGALFNGTNLSDLTVSQTFNDSTCNSFNVNVTNNIIWIEKPQNNIICNSNIPFEVSFDFLISTQYDDVNQDNLWNILDILLTINFILNIIEPTDSQFESANLNNDNDLNILDIILMVNLIL